LRRLKIGPALALACVACIAQAGPASHAAFPGRDGRIAFTRAVHGSPNGFTFAIHTVGPAGKRPRTVIAEGSQPAYSATGDQIAYVVGTTLYVANANGHERRAIAQGTNPAWSPSGDRLVVEQGTSDEGDTSTGSPNLAIVDVETGASRPLSKRAGSPAWSPDGRYIAFVDYRSQAFRSITRIRPDGTGRKVIYRADPQWATAAPDWSPDGNSLAFVKSSQKASSLAVIAAGGGQRHRVARRSAKHPFTSVAWAPSGGRLAFAAYKGTRQNVYTVSVGGGQPVLVAHRAFDPAWRPKK
jgi:Tol biopolymer transport system component